MPNDIEIKINRQAVLETLSDLQVAGIQNIEKEYLQLQIQNLIDQLIKTVPEMEKGLKS